MKAQESQGQPEEANALALQGPEMAFESGNHDVVATLPPTMSLALVNSTCEYSAEQRVQWQERAEQVWADGIEAVLPALMARWFTDEAATRRIPGYDYVQRTAARFPPASFAAVTHAMRALDTSDQLTDISQPTLVVAAPEDPGVPIELSKRLAARIPSAELHWLTPARHLASLEHVDTFNQLLRAFLLRVSSNS